MTPQDAIIAIAQSATMTVHNFPCLKKHRKHYNYKHVHYTVDIYKHAATKLSLHRYLCYSLVAIEFNRRKEKTHYRYDLSTNVIITIILH